MNGRTSVVEGTFAETKEILGGFNLIEAADMVEAARLAAEFPGAHTGCVEAREVRGMNGVRRRVGTSGRPAGAERLPCRLLFPLLPDS